MKFADASFFYSVLAVMFVSLSLVSVKSRLVLPFRYRLTWVVLEKGPLNVCVCVCVSTSSCCSLGNDYTTQPFQTV